MSSSSTQTQTHQNIINNHIHEKNILKVEINKEIGADLKIHRYEDVVDDDHYQRRSNNGIIRINVDSNNNRSIPERKSGGTFEAAEQHRAQTLVIDDANNDKFARRAVNIDGQMHVHKNEVQINEQQQQRVDYFNVAQKSVEELNRQLELIKREKQTQVETII